MHVNNYNFVNFSQTTFPCKGQQQNYKLLQQPERNISTERKYIEYIMRILKHKLLTAWKKHAKEDINTVGYTERAIDMRKQENTKKILVPKRKV